MAAATRVVVFILNSKSSESLDVQIYVRGTRFEGTIPTSGCQRMKKSFSKVLVEVLERSEVGIKIDVEILGEGVVQIVSRDFPRRYARKMDPNNNKGKR